MARWPKRRVDGVLLLDKPSGMTSNGALQVARRLFRAAKAGHTGTLDPLASGLLPLAFGEATKFCQALLEADKRYETELLLGVRTDSGDAQGQVIATRPAAVTEAQVEAVLVRFRGRIEQVPPMHSALKRDGQPLYRLARQGVVVERPPRPVTIHALELAALGDASLRLRVHCSKGTYIRALADDIGEALGCGAHVCALRRTAIGAFAVDEALTLAGLEALAEPQRDTLLGPVDELLAGWPQTRLDPQAAARFAHGAAVPAPASLPAFALCRVHGERGFLGTARHEDGRLLPQRLCMPAALFQETEKLEDL